MALSIARPSARPSAAGRLGRLLIPDYPHLLWDGRRWLAAAAILFGVSGLLAFAVSVLLPGAAIAQATPFIDRLHEMSARVLSSGSPLQRSLLIYVNNVLLVYFMLDGGLLAGIVPAATLIVNGALTGAMFGLGGRLSVVGASPLLLLASIAPHGIFEVPAMCLGGAWGMRLGLRWLAPAASGRRKRVLGRSVLEAGQVFVLAAALLLVAAFVEANLTLALVRALHG